MGNLAASCRRTFATACAIWFRKASSIRRVCIVGASYGGYAALAGVSPDPSVYRCAVPVAGIGSLRSFLIWVDDKHLSHENLEQRYWDRFLGVSSRKDPRLDEISPIKHVDAITAPVLLIHGKDDTVVPFDQSDDMYDALRHANKEVLLVALKDEDHWLSRGATRLQMLHATVDFLKKSTILPGLDAGPWCVNARTVIQPP